MAGVRSAGGLELGRRPNVGVVAALVIVILSAIVVIDMAERGDFSRFARASTASPLPGITLSDGTAGDGPGGAMPVVTSVRSGSEAKQRGIRAGDAIIAVDGRPVRSVAAVRDAIGARPNQGPLDLHLRRGDAIVSVSIDRFEPQRRTVMAKVGDGAKNPAD